MRSRRRVARLAWSMVKRSTLTPGRPSGVSASASSHSIPASHLQPITDVANPVILSAAARAQRGDFAVITTRATRIGNASAKVSSIVTPRRRISRTSGIAAPLHSEPRAAGHRHSGARVDRDRGIGEVSDRIILELQRREVFEELANVAQHPAVILWTDMKAPAARRPPQLALFHHELSSLHDVARRREHLRHVVGT